MGAYGARAQSRRLATCPVEVLILAVGSRMPAWVDQAFSEYQKRMPPDARLRLLEIKPEKRTGGKPAAQLMAAEAARITAALPRDTFRIALDERGTQLTSVSLAAHWRDWRNEGRDLAFIIGGPDGLAPPIKSDANFLWSLSQLTLPHALVRVMLAEQLYRAISILQQHPYHRE